MPGFGNMPGASCQHLAPEFPVPGAFRQVTASVGKWGIPEKGFQKAVQKCLFQVASALQSKIKPDEGNFATRIMPCKIGAIFEQNT